MLTGDSETGLTIFFIAAIFFLYRCARTIKNMRVTTAIDAAITPTTTPILAPLDNPLSEFEASSGSRLGSVTALWLGIVEVEAPEVADTVIEEDPAMVDERTVAPRKICAILTAPGLPGPASQQAVDLPQHHFSLVAVPSQGVTSVFILNKSYKTYH